MAAMALLAAASAWGADWLGAPAIQPKETVLNAGNVNGLRVIWRYKLDSRPVAGPVVLGRWITNRGTKELLFIGAGRDVYALDGDLGTLFWKRAFNAPVACLALAPGDDSAADEDDDDDDDKPQALRPLAVRLTGGEVRLVHPTHGGDLPGTPGASCNNAGYRAITANGVVFRAEGKVLRATSASTGKLLYSSGAILQAQVATGVAVANGHVCFGTADKVVHCFGFPVDP